MSLISVKGALTGALMATAGALVVSTTPAQAASCTTVGTIGSLATPCEIGDYSLTINSFSNAGLGFLAQVNSFGISQIGPGLPGGSFNFTVNAAPGRFFTSSSFTLGSNVSSVATPFFTFAASGDTFAFPDASVTSITGTYTYAATPPLSISAITFTTDVPVPLPVVGAGLAFGFTRNLRKRAKSVA